jgi:hypothetical protein
VLGGDLDRGGDVECWRNDLLQAEGETGSGGCEEGEVPSAGGGPFDVVDGL